MKVAEVIHNITKYHLENNNGLLLGQSITALGRVNGTVPDTKNVVELPLTDVAAAGFAVGTALVGRRPIFVLRTHGLFMLNCNQLLQYAAISRELHGAGVPVYIRCIGMDAAGPVHSIMLHSLPMHFPGIAVAAPMTPAEYQEVWNAYMNDDAPYFVSEHKSSYGNKENWEDELEIGNADITIYAISDARASAIKAAEELRKTGVKVNLMHVLWLKPFHVEEMKEPLERSKVGMVVDNGFPVCGAARDLAYQLIEGTGKFVKALSCADKVKCFNPESQNKTPDSRTILSEALKLLKESV